MVCGVQKGVKSLMRSFKSNYEIHLQLGSLSGRACAHTHISLGTIGKAGILL